MFLLGTRRVVGRLVSVSTDPKRSTCPTVFLFPFVGDINGSSPGGALDDVIVVANKADLLPTNGGGVEDDTEELSSLAATTACGGTTWRRARSGVGENGESALGGGDEGGGGRRGRVWRVSCKTKEGLDGFMEYLEAEVRARFQRDEDDESPLITRCENMLWSDCFGVILYDITCSPIGSRALELELYTFSEPV